MGNQIVEEYEVPDRAFPLIIMRNSKREIMRTENILSTQYSKDLKQLST